MSMEDKNEWVIQYVNALAKQINEKYNNIVKQDHIDRVISMYKDSDKEIETIKEEIDKMTKEFIENYLKKMQEIREEMLRKKQEEQEKMLEQLRKLNPSVQIDIQNKIKNEQIESKIISSIPKEQLKLPENITLDENNRIINNNLGNNQNENDLDSTFIKTFPKQIDLNNELNSNLEKLNKNNNSIVNNVSNESIINTNDSYEMIKMFCNNISHVDNIFDRNFVNKTNIPIETSKLISKEIVNKISPIYSEKFEEYINQYVKFEKGDSTLSKSNHIMYDESISDIYTTVHEFFHYYCVLKNKNIPSNIKNTIGIYDEAKSIMSEEIVTQILKEKIVNLSKYNININDHELNYYSFSRLYGEREVSGLYVFLKNMNNYLEISSKENKPLTINSLDNYFKQFNKDSIEYKTYKENINGKFFKYLLKDENMFNNDKYYTRYKHPISYLVSLDLIKNVDLKNNDFSGFNTLVQNIKNVDINKINTPIIKDGKIDNSKIEYAKNLLLEKQKNTLNIKNETKIEKNSKNVQSKQQTKNVSKPIPKQPSIPPKRQEEKQIKNTKPIKMNDFEKKAYPPLKQKQNIKIQARKQVQNKANVKTLKNTYKGTSNKNGSGTSGNGSKGFVNIILGSIISIIIGLILFIIIK